MIRALRFLVLRLPAHLWRSEYRFQLLGSWFVSAAMLYQGNGFISGLYLGVSFLWISEWLPEQWPRTFDHLKRRGDS